MDRPPAAPTPADDRPAGPARRLEDRLLDLATLLMAAAMLFMVFEASSRTAAARSHWWAEELVRFLVVWSVMLAAGSATRRGHFIAMDLLLDRLRPRPRLALQAAAFALAALFALALGAVAVVEVVHLHRIGMITESNLDLPLWLVRLALPLGALLYALAYGAECLRLARAARAAQ